MCGRSHLESIAKNKLDVELEFMLSTAQNSFPHKNMKREK